MNAWSNISVSAQDPEIISIDGFETGLGKLPEQVVKIRELITRHEVCHFKYQHHLNIIKRSILTLEPLAIPETIGKNHIQHGENAWRNDATGRSLLGQQYLWAVRKWLGDLPPSEIPDEYDKIIGQKVSGWLGGKNEDKIRLVQLLLARMTWDWGSYEKLQQGGEWKELEYQICRMDICHYNFPFSLDRVLQGIGEMRPADGFEGCGTFNNAIRESVAGELHSLKELFISVHKVKSEGTDNRMRLWLLACLMKTLKAQAELSALPIDINEWSG